MAVYIQDNIGLENPLNVKDKLADKIINNNKNELNLENLNKL